MIICSCACVSEKDISGEIAAGYNTVDALSERLNVAQICGSCLPDVERLIAESKVDGSTHPSLQFMEISGVPYE